MSAAMSPRPSRVPLCRHADHYRSPPARSDHIIILRSRHYFAALRPRRCPQDIYAEYISS